MKKRADGRYVHTAMVDGKRKFFYGDTPKEAILKAEAANVVLKRNFANDCEDWEEEIRERITTNTWRCYSAPYKRIKEYFSETNTEDISEKDIKNFLNTLIRQKYSYKTVKTHKWILQQITGIDVPVPKGLPKGKRELPNPEQIDLIKKSVDCHFGLFPYFILYSGCRRGEALAIRDTDIKNGILTIKNSVYFDGNQPKVKSPKTNAGIREIPLPDHLIDLLKGKKGYLFGQDKLMTEMAYRRAWERYCRETGVNVTPHQIRHAYATLLFDNDIDVKTAQILMGHTDLKLTLDIYTHISDQRKIKTNMILKSLV